MTTTLLDDPVAADRAAAASAPVAGAWDRAARRGLADDDLRAAARGCLEAAVRRRPRRAAAEVEALAALVERGRLPGRRAAGRTRPGSGPAGALLRATAADRREPDDATCARTWPADLTTARDRTLLLTDHDEPELVRQHSPLMSPLVWDLAHIGQQEDLWLLRRGDAAPAGAAAGGRSRRSTTRSRQPRAVRDRLPLLPPVEARAFCAGGARPGARPAGRGSGDADDPFDFAMVVSHEQQHDETMLQAHQLRSGPAAARRRRAAAARAARPGRHVGAGARRAVRARGGRRRRAVLAGQRAARAPGRPAGVPRSAGCR